MVGRWGILRRGQRCPELGGNRGYAPTCRNSLRPQGCKRGSRERGRNAITRNRGAPNSCPFLDSYRSPGVPAAHRVLPLAMMPNVPRESNPPAEKPGGGRACLGPPPSPGPVRVWIRSSWSPEKQTQGHRSPLTATNPMETEGPSHVHRIPGFQ